MKKKNYIQPDIKWITTSEEGLMAASITGTTTDGQTKVEVDPYPTDQEGGAKDNTWHTTSVWD